MLRIYYILPIDTKCILFREEKPLHSIKGGGDSSSKADEVKKNLVTHVLPSDLIQRGVGPWKESVELH